jgi:hypothetical protein
MSKREQALNALRDKQKAWGIIFTSRLEWAVARGDSPEAAMTYAIELTERCMKLYDEKAAEYNQELERIERALNE